MKLVRLHRFSLKKFLFNRRKKYSQEQKGYSVEDHWHPCNVESLFAFKLNSPHFFAELSDEVIVDKQKQSAVCFVCKLSIKQRLTPRYLVAETDLDQVPNAVAPRTDERVCPVGRTCVQNLNSIPNAHKLAP